ncbi:uncharacterized protein LOC135168304 isoform X2 [Diachasmimorpha longicaudata]|uniref:uncharacterized protein LOC135168304 isoform X2 n=1 Tax=Diachasmimorpha longicaudata TaxID=58733 RepID=UPI0030B891CD
MNRNSNTLSPLGFNCLSLSWFNSKLFIVNGAPFKFYLMGFDSCETCEIVKIIEAYGGKLSHPDFPDTFVFRDPGRPIITDKYDLYNIKFFYDSIVALQRQNLINYRLQVSMKSPIANFVNRESARSAVGENRSDHDQDSMDCDCELSINETPRVFPKDDQSSQRETIKENNNKFPQPMSCKPLVLINKQTANLIMGEELRIYRDNEEADNSSKENPAHEFPPIIETQVELTLNTNSSNATITNVDSREVRNLENVHPEDTTEATGTESEAHINDQDGDDLIAIITENGESSEDTAKVRRAIKPEANFDVEAAANDDLVPSRFRRRPHSVGGQNEKRIKTTFTEEDREKIMSWVIEKEVIPSNTGKNIWQEFLDEKILPDLTCGPASLARYYSSHLKNHPKIQRFMKEARAEGKKLKRMTSRYTEEEDRILIQYLVDNDVIHRATGESVWEECLVENKIGGVRYIQITNYMRLKIQAIERNIR